MSLESPNFSPGQDQEAPAREYPEFDPGSLNEPPPPDAVYAEHICGRCGKNHPLEQECSTS